MDIEARVAYLEEQNAGLKRVGLLGLLLVLILGGVVVYQAWADLGGITTTGIVFQDDRPRSALVTTASGHLALVPALPLGTLPELEQRQGLDFQGLGIYDTKGRVRFLLGVNSLDQPVVGIIGEKGETLWTPLQMQQAAPPATPGAPATPPAAPPTPGAPKTP